MDDLTEGAAIGDGLAVELVKGPDPDEWGEGQTIAPEPERPLTAADIPDGVKGPDPAKWGDAQAGITDE